MNNEPYNFNLESFKMDMADFILPEDDESVEKIASALSSLLDNREWARRSGKPDSLLTQTNNGYWMMVIGRLVLEAAEKNGLQSSQLEGVRR